MLNTVRFGCVRVYEKQSIFWLTNCTIFGQSQIGLGLGLVLELRLGLQNCPNVQSIWLNADWVRVRFSFRVTVRLAELPKCATHLVKRAACLVKRTLTKCALQL